MIHRAFEKKNMYFSRDGVGIKNRVRWCLFQGKQSLVLAFTCCRDLSPHVLRVYVTTPGFLNVLGFFSHVAVGKGFPVASSLGILSYASLYTFMWGRSLLPPFE